MQVINFEESAVTTLRRRVGEIEEINETLIAFARGHAGAVGAIHEAVLAIIPATDAEELATIITRRWPALLSVDTVAFAWTHGAAASHADGDGLRPIESRLLTRMMAETGPVELRAVARGHALFGAAAAAIRSEAVIRLSWHSGEGLIVLGQTETAPLEGRHGARLLRFLGQTISRTMERWPVR